ncbi:putative membrane protein [Sphingomonas zeicaulis]|uniref:DUF2339 domain-containing protein n=1 Tax=Sphingomonas zeicaulis TaxID=1632740 RepID=UPI003D1D4C9C
MLFAYALIIVLAVLLFDTRSKLAFLRKRLEVLEDQDRAATRPEHRTAAAAQSSPSATDVRAVEDGRPPDHAGGRPLEEVRKTAPAVAPQPAIVLAKVQAPRPPEPPRAAPAAPAGPAGQPVTPPAPPRPAAPVKPPRPRISFEELFGRRLPIWAGGATLAVAGVLIVKYSIDAGLLSPLVRVVMGLLFGALLIGSAEAARRFEAKLRDPRVAQALSGAGIASLYASILIAANLYGLISPTLAFIGLAGTTALALGLALRFGAPSALLGLIGGLAAPALVGSTEPNIPLLVTYLALAIGGLGTLSRGQRWAWLGIGALIGGFGWGAVLLLTGALDRLSAVSLGLFLVLLGVGLPMLIASGRLQTLIRGVAPLVAAAQIATLVATGGFTLLHWGLFALISVAIIWLSTRDAKLARLPALAVAIALLLFGTWPDPTIRDFAIAATGLGLIFAIPALVRLWRTGGGLVEAGQIAAIALAGHAVTLFQFRLGDASRDAALALIALATALPPALGAGLGWRTAERRNDFRFVTLVTAVALLIGSAIILGLVEWSWTPMVALVAGGLLLLGRAVGDKRIEPVGWGAGLGAIMLLVAGDQDMLDQFDRIVGIPADVTLLPALLRWSALTAVAGLYAWGAGHRITRAVAQVLTVLFGYCVIAQVVPPTPLPLVTAALLVAIAAAARARPQLSLLPALGGALFLILGWAALPFAHWAGPAYISLVGDPLLMTELPALRDTLLRLLIPAAATGGALWLLGTRLTTVPRWIGTTAGLALAIGVGQILFKQIFHIDSYEAFTRLGLIERTCWEALLAAAGIAIWRRHRITGRIVIGAALAHFTWYTLALHNPLWWEQAVGGIPVLSWLLAAYGLPLALLWAFGRYEPEAARRFAMPRAIAQMVLIAILAGSVLRQIFVGNLLTVIGVSEMEDISRSVITIALAIGFLLWGIAKRSRLWRVASLLLIIAAVIKVFLFDAAGLDGLARIGSFVALGFSLIGIGWLYSRQLSRDQAPEKTTEEGVN